MAGRDLSQRTSPIEEAAEQAATQGALESRVVTPVLILRLDILTDPLTAWTGFGTFAPSDTGDTAMDGQVFVPAAPVVEMSDISENQGIGDSVTLTIAGNHIDLPLLRQIVRDRRQWRGRDAWIWIGLLDEDKASVYTSPIRVKTGVMTQMTVDRKPTNATVTITIDKDLGRAKGAPFRWVDHPRLYPTDTWSSFIIALSNRPEGLTNTNLNTNYSGGTHFRNKTGVRELPR